MFVRGNENTEMPIYEYLCRKCLSEFEVFYKSFVNQKQVICALCESADVAKQVSRITLRSRSGSSSPDDYYSDSSNIGRGVEGTFASHGIEMPANVRESIDSARSGKMPDGLEL